jgi:hypothetical protein
MVGEALAPVRYNFKIATKFGWDINQDTGVHYGRVTADRPRSGAASRAA